MEQKIMVVGDGIKREIIGESLFDCVDTAYRMYRGRSMRLIRVKEIGCIDGHALYVDPACLDRSSVKEIMGSKSTE